MPPALPLAALRLTCLRIVVALIPQGAVLEPQGVVEIKFRTPELIATMHRIDPVILKLKVGGICPTLLSTTSLAAECMVQVGTSFLTKIPPACVPPLASCHSFTRRSHRLAPTGGGQPRQRRRHQGTRAPAAASVPPSGGAVCAGAVAWGLVGGIGPRVDS